MTTETTQRPAPAKTPARLDDCYGCGRPIVTRTADDAKLEDAGHWCPACGGNAQVVTV